METWGSATTKRKTLEEKMQCLPCPTQVFLGRWLCLVFTDINLGMQREDKINTLKAYQKISDYGGKAHKIGDCRHNISIWLLDRTFNYIFQEDQEIFEGLDPLASYTNKIHRLSYMSRLSFTQQNIY